jgi:hypothetical protein
MKLDIKVNTGSTIISNAPAPGMINEITATHKRMGNRTATTGTNNAFAKYSISDSPSR